LPDSSGFASFTFIHNERVATMIPVKVQCGCGQPYAFEVNPVHGHMPVAVKCPACGADGTVAANQFIAQVLAAQPEPAASSVAVSDAPIPSTGSGIRLAPVPAGPTVAAVAPTPPAVRSAPATIGAADGWDAEETQVNKLGTYLTVGTPLLAALLSAGVFGIALSPALLGLIVGIAGLIGGALNIAGRGPVLAGALVGVVIALGGYGVVYWWIHDKESVRKFEVIIALVVGVIPGFLLQAGLQALLRKRAG
jgi:hypothetical protein